MRKVFKKFLLAGFAATLTLSVAETILRWFPAFNPRPRFIVEGTESPESKFIADPEIGWTMRPLFSSADGRVTSNAAGFRGPRGLPTTAGSLAVVGDSFSFGTDVADTEPYAALLDATLGEPGVVNLAMPAFGVDQVWLTVKHRALALKPRLIVVGIVELDFERSQTRFDRGKRFARPWFHVVDGRLVPRAQDDLRGPVVRQLEAHGRLWRAGQLAMQRLGHSLPIGEWWTLNAAFLDEIQNVSSANGTAVLFVHLPTVEWLPFPMLRRHLNARRANFVDIRDDFPAPPDGFFLPGGHPSARGHRFIADTILKWIRNHPVESGRVGAG